MSVTNHEGPVANALSEGQGPFHTTGRKIFRYGAVLPLAAVMTIGLMGAMASFVATEFSPQNKSEVASFEINPVVEDIPAHIERVKLEPVKAVVIPPPPEPLPIEKASVDKSPPVTVPGKKVEFDPGRLDFDFGKNLSIANADSKPLVRIPPVFPNRFLQGNVSGYCRVRFDVSPDGKPYNVVATLCTNRMLERPTIKSVQKWNYTPKMQNGRAVLRSGLETTIRFDLKDERDEVLPVPAGY